MRAARTRTQAISTITDSRHKPAESRNVCAPPSELASLARREHAAVAQDILNPTQFFKPLRLLELPEVRSGGVFKDEVPAFDDILFTPCQHQVGELVTGCDFGLQSREGLYSIKPSGLRAGPELLGLPPRTLDEDVSSPGERLAIRGV